MSDNSKVERMDVVHSELDSLQRKFRDMEAKHRLFNDDSIQTIRVQRSKIEKLKFENERIKQELALETHTRSNTRRKSKSKTRSRPPSTSSASVLQSSRSGNSRSRSRRATSALNKMSASSKLAALQEQTDSQQRKIEIERRRISELDLQMKKMSESILQQRSDMGGIHANRDTSQTIQKNIRMLENRLDKALVKYNEALGHNKKLRSSIDNLRRERVVFDGIYRKLEGDLLSIKNQMSSVINEANRAYEVRDCCQSEMLQLKTGFDKQQKQFELEWSELTTLIDKDSKMNAFLNSSERSADQMNNDAEVNSVMQEEQELRKRLSKGAWKIVKDKAHIHLAQEKVSNYQQSFQKIQNATNISDIDELVQTFIHSEEHNFKLFNQVNKLSNDIQRAQHNIQHLNQEILKSGGNNGNNDKDATATATGDTSIDASADSAVSASTAVNQRKQILNDLREQISSTESKTKLYESQHLESLQTMASLKDGISKILNIVNSNQSNFNLHTEAEQEQESDVNDEENENMSDILNMISNTGVTESNIMEILGFVEAKTNKLIDNYLDASRNINIDSENATDAEAEEQSMTDFKSRASRVSDMTMLNMNMNMNNKSDAHLHSHCLSDPQAGAAALGIGIGASQLQALVVAPSSLFDDQDLSDISDEEENEDHNQQLENAEMQDTLNS